MRSIEVRIPVMHSSEEKLTWEMIFLLRRVSSRMHDGASVATSGANKYRRIKGRDRKLDRYNAMTAEVQQRANHPRPR